MINGSNNNTLITNPSEFLSASSSNLTQNRSKIRLQRPTMDEDDNIFVQPNAKRLKRSDENNQLITTQENSNVQDEPKNEGQMYSKQEYDYYQYAVEQMSFEGGSEQSVKRHSILNDVNGRASECESKLKLLSIKDKEDVDVEKDKQDGQEKSEHLSKTTMNKNEQNDEVELTVSVNTETQKQEINNYETEKVSEQLIQDSNEQNSQSNLSEQSNDQEEVTSKFQLQPASQSSSENQSEESSDDEVSDLVEEDVNDLDKEHSDFNLEDYLKFKKQIEEEEKLKKSENDDSQQSSQEDYWKDDDSSEEEEEYNSSYFKKGNMRSQLNHRKSNQRRNLRRGK